MIDPEVLEFIESTSKAMRSMNNLIHTLHNKVTQLEIDNKAINLELEHISNAIKPKGIK